MCSIDQRHGLNRRDNDAATERRIRHAKQRVRHLRQPHHAEGLKKKEPALSTAFVARRFGIKPATHCRACNRRLPDGYHDNMCDECLLPASLQRPYLYFGDPLDAPSSPFDPYYIDPADITYLANVILYQNCISPDVDDMLGMEE